MSQGASGLGQQLDLKDLADLDGFLPNLDDLGPAFAWPGGLGASAAPDALPNIFVSGLPPGGLQGALDFSFDPAAQQPPQLRSVPIQHRLLNDKGLAYSVPDLMAAAPSLGSGPGPLQNDALAQPQPPAREQPHTGSSNSGDLGVQSAPRGKSQLSLAERNKQAQRRHRQRQRDRMEMLEGQVRTLQEEKQALAAEKAALAGQAAVLGQVLAMRDEQLQQAQAAAAGGAPAAAREAPVGVCGRSEAAVSSGLADNLAAILTLTVREEGRIHLTPEQVRALAPADVARLWAEYMRALMQQLAAAEQAGAEAGPRAERRISELLQEVLVLLMRYALGDIHKMKQFVVGRASTAPAPEGPAGREAWRAAARNLRLSQPQRAALCRLRELFLAKQEALLGARRGAVAELQRCVPSVASSHDIAVQFLKAEEAMARIHDNLLLENQLIVDLIYTLLIKVASPVQAARCLVQSFPLYPDSLCILTCIAAEAGDAAAAALLGLEPEAAAPPEDGSAGAAASEPGSGGGTPEAAAASPAHSP